MKRFGWLVVASVLATTAVAQKDLNGIGQFPQFRSLSGLPGGGFGVGKDGKPLFDGAFSLSTPIAYSLDGISLGIANLSDSLRPRFFGTGRGEGGRSNGTAFVMGGTRLGELGTFSGTYMVLSSIGDMCFNFQFTPNIRQEKFAVAVGVQDAFNSGGEAGEVLDSVISPNSRSWYGVATFEAQKDVFVSVGAGGRRFDGPFGNVSFPIAPRLRGMVEYDTFNWNVGVLGEVYRFQQRGGYDPKHTSASAFLGVVRGKYLTWGLNISF